MIAPGKFTTLSDSILCKSLTVFDAIGDGGSLGDIFQKAIENGIDIDDFLLSVDLLWIMGKIAVNTDVDEVRYVG